MTPVFIRINDSIYNISCIKEISFDSKITNPKLVNKGLERVFVSFQSHMGIKPLHGFTYWASISQMIYDWKHNKSSIFEITILNIEEAIEEAVRYEKEEKASWEKMLNESEECKND